MKKAVLVLCLMALVLSAKCADETDMPSEDNASPPPAEPTGASTEIPTEASSPDGAPENASPP